MALGQRGIHIVSHGVLTGDLGFLGSPKDKTSLFRRLLRQERSTEDIFLPNVYNIQVISFHFKDPFGR